MVLTAARPDRSSFGCGEADKIIVLEKGTVIESGSHEELLGNEKGLYRYLSQLQFEV